MPERYKPPVNSPQFQRSIPAIVAVRKFANVPANIARIPSLARSPRRDGASDPMPPIWIAIDEKFAKPHNAYVTMTKLRGSRLDPTPGLPRFAKATNSLSTMRVPRRLPTVRLSFHDTPIAHAIGLKIHPRS